MKGLASISAMMLLLGVTACNRLGTERSYAVVENTAAKVKAAFNADAGKVRVLMVVSPTCGKCLEGASEVSEQVAEINQGKVVPLYVLWVPRSGGREKDVPAATRVIADTSAHEFWDGNDLLGTQYKQVLMAWQCVGCLYGLWAKGAVDWGFTLDPGLLHAPDF